MKLITLALTTVILAALPSCSQDSPQQGLVSIERLKESYPSCALVDFSIRNTSPQEIHVEVYAESFHLGSWQYAEYPYDLTDPKSLYVKRVLVNPSMLKPGASLALSYDRCLQPTFVKEDNKAFKEAFDEKDRKANSRSRQRFRIEVYVWENGQLTLAKNALSVAFQRVPNKKPQGSANH
ncbi:MAG TPA: hypothetical protein VJN89_22475 [Candidatus Acidoferrum sp.]|nr:hypothetical protein [Candidatus Acidoferrum sp.]